MMAAKSLNFLFTTADLGGNVSPIMPVVRRLVERGHAVRVMSDGTNRRDAEDAGARFVGWTRAPHKSERRRDTELPDWDVPVKDGLRMVAEFVGGTSLAYAQDTIEELAREPADLVVGFDMLLGPMLGCEAVGQRLALLGTMISFFPLAGLPPLGSGRAPARTADERQAENVLRREFEAVFDAGCPALNAARTALGLPGVAHLADQWDAAEVHWLGTARAFDFPGAQLKTNMRYAGPLVGDPAWAEPWRSPWPARDARPLVLVGFSTSFQDHAGILQSVVEAASALPLRALVTLGGAIRPDEVRGTENCVVVQSAPHTQVMAEASLVVTHGGHGTVMAALLHGLPMLVIPHGRDQGDNAVRVTERGAGLALPKTARVGELRSALERLLGEASFRANARALGEAISAEARASTLIDELVALAARPARRTAPAGGPRLRAG
jgi:MGT family glycosyltransferase